MEKIHEINNEIVNTQNQIAQAKHHADQLPALYQELGRLNALREVEGYRLAEEQKKNKALEVTDGEPNICRDNDAAGELHTPDRGAQQVSADE